MAYYLITTAILVVLCKKDYKYTFWLTLIVYLACIVAFLINYEENVKEIDGMYYIIKRISFIIGYLSYVLIYIFNNNKSKLFAQWLLFFSIFQVAVVSFFKQWYVLSFLVGIISIFTPKFRLNSKNTFSADKGFILTTKDNSSCAILSLKWFFRLLCITMIVWYQFTSHCIKEADYSQRCNFFGLQSVLIPQLLNEVYGDNFSNHFAIRSFSLVIMSAIASIDKFYHFRWNIINLIEIEDTIQTNILHGIIIFLLLLVFKINDYCRQRKEVYQTKKAKNVSKDTQVIHLKVENNLQCNDNEENEHQIEPLQYFQNQEK